MESQYDKIFEPIIYDGRFLNEADNANYRKVCVIGKTIAGKLFGTMSGVGKDIQLNNIYYKVVGVVGQTSEINIGANMDESIFIPSNSMRRSYNLGNKIDIFMMTFRQGTRPGDYEKRLRRIIASNHPIAPDDEGAFNYFNISEMFEMVDNVFAGITLLALVVGTGTLMSGIIGVGNIMWIIVRERTHEIGIRRAIGAKPRDIIVQILSESMVLTTVAGIAGEQDVEESYDLGTHTADKKKELVEFRLGYTEKGYTNFCKKCRGFTTHNTEAMQPAEQVNQCGGHVEDALL